MGYEKRLMSFWKKKKTDGIKDQECSGTKKVIEIPSTSTTKHLKEKKNEIRGVWNKDKKWCEDLGGIASIARKYFKELFSTSYPTKLDEVANLIPRRITPEMNE